MASHRCIVRKSDNTVLVRATPDQVIELEGNRYLHPSTINLSQFELSDRVYTCPHKGTCLWVDLKTDQTYVNDVAWVYQHPKPHFQQIAGWYGFYVDHRYYSFRECD